MLMFEREVGGAVNVCFMIVSTAVVSTGGLDDWMVGGASVREHVYLARDAL